MFKAILKYHYLSVLIALLMIGCRSKVKDVGLKTVDQLSETNYSSRIDIKSVLGINKFTGTKDSINTLVIGDSVFFDSSFVEELYNYKNIEIVYIGKDKNLFHYPYKLKDLRYRKLKKLRVFEASTLLHTNGNLFSNLFPHDSLQVLRISRNLLMHLPESTLNCPNLHKIEVFESKTYNYFDKVNGVNQYEDALPKYPSFFAKLDLRHFVSIYSETITEEEFEKICELENLELLDILISSKRKDFSKITNLGNLKSLSLRIPEKEIPQEINNLNKLNYLRIIPAYTYKSNDTVIIPRIVNVKTLSLHSFSKIIFEALPSELESIETIYLKYPNMEDLPEELLQLPKLKKLCLVANKGMDIKNLEKYCEKLDTIYYRGDLPVQDGRLRQKLYQKYYGKKLFPFGFGKDNYKDPIHILRGSFDYY